MVAAALQAAAAGYDTPTGLAHRRGQCRTTALKGATVTASTAAISSLEREHHAAERD